MINLHYWNSAELKSCHTYKWNKLLVILSGKWFELKSSGESILFEMAFVFLSQTMLFEPGTFNCLYASSAQCYYSACVSTLGIIFHSDHLPFTLNLGPRH